MFVNLPTDFGKSLIFQCLPIVANIVHDKPRGSASVIVAISPLRSLMEDQVLYLNNIYIPAIAITRSHNHRCGRPRKYPAGFKWEFPSSVRLSRYG